MAGYPPPYPPPGAPFGYDPRQQRRILREQTRAHMRAMQAANRAQRELYRQQNRAMRRGSILGPIIVIAVGVIFFLTRLRSISLGRFAVWFAHWWPLLLIFAGVILVIEWAIDQHLSTKRGVPVRRGIGAGTVFLLILLAISGTVIGTIHAHSGFLFHNFAVDPDNIGEFLGERHDRQQELDGNVPVGATVEINDPRGDITVTGGSSDGQIHVTVNKQIYSFSDSDADSKDRDMTATMQLLGETLKVAVPSVNGGSADLTVSLPEGSHTIVNGGHGAVNISSISAPVSVSSDHGDIDLQSIQGSVIAHLNNSSSSFHANSVQGEVQLRGRGEDVTLADVSGPVTLDGEFYGDTHLEHLQGPLSFRTDRTQFSLARLDGEVDISPSSELTGNQIVGPTVLHTRNRNISLERVAGDLSVINSNGHVDLASALPLGNVTVDNHNGEVELTLPEKAGFSLTAQAREGTILDDLGLTATEHNRDHTVTGKRGNGASIISLHTTHSDISLHEAAAVALTNPPTPPAAPAVPSKKTSKAPPAAPKLTPETF